eukprot:gene2002-12455_t
MFLYTPWAVALLGTGEWCSLMGDPPHPGWILRWGRTTSRLQSRASVLRAYRPPRHAAAVMAQIVAAAALGALRAMPKR